LQVEPRGAKGGRQEKVKNDEEKTVRLKRKNSGKRGGKAGAVLYVLYTP
jgi:hypothetical protein